MTKIILFNGPPGAGKDTLANQMFQYFGFGETVKFAAPLKTVAMHLYCGGDSRKFFEFDLDQAKKNEPNDVFLGKSCRQVQIDISETYMKPNHGQQVFGKFLKNHILKRSDEGMDVFYVSDSGFRPEAEVLVEEFGAQNVLLVRIHREGHTYEGDSRDYINLDDLEVESIDLTNHPDNINKTLEELTPYVHNFIAGA